MADLEGFDEVFNEEVNSSSAELKATEEVKAKGRKPKAKVAIAPVPEVVYPVYEELEFVMAEDNGNIYPAQIIKKVEKDGPSTVQYFIHYKGWNRKYDVWVPPAQICRKGDPIAQQQLQAYSNAKTPKVKGSNTANAHQPGEGGEGENGGSSSSSSSSSGARSGIKRKSNAELEEEARDLKKNRSLLSGSDLLQEDDADMAAAERMDIPLGLKKHLVDEWSLIAQNEPRRLLRLPRKLTVDKVVSEFLDACEQGIAAKLNQSQLESYKDFFQGFALYFDKALPTILLYRWERAQYTAASEKFSDLSPSGIYGAEHLLRLFVRLPKLFTGLFDSQTEINEVQHKMNTFLKYLQKNIATYIVIEDYVLEDEGLVIGDAAPSSSSSSQSSNAKKQ